MCAGCSSNLCAGRGVQEYAIGIKTPVGGSFVRSKIKDRKQNSC